MVALPRNKKSLCSSLDQKRSDMGSLWVLRVSPQSTEYIRLMRDMVESLSHDDSSYLFMC